MPLVTSFEKIDIHVDSSGKFYCDLGDGDRIERDSLDAVKDAIKKAKKVAFKRFLGIKFDYSRSAQVLEITSILAGKEKFRHKGGEIWSSDPLYIFDPNKCANLIRILSEKKKLEEALAAECRLLKKELPSVTVRDFREGVPDAVQEQQALGINVKELLASIETQA
jgi:hypothetical protein